MRNGDKNCCTVVALSILADITFDEAQEIMGRAGRKRNQGFSRQEWQPIYERYGKLDKSIWANYRFKQIRTLFRNESEYLKDHIVVINTNKHVFVSVFGEIQDWMSKNRRHEIWEIWTFTPKGMKESTERPEQPKPIKISYRK
jgi:hypothetical protein